MKVSPIELAGVIDHTLLKPEATNNDIVALCRQARVFGFATVCINPCYIALARRELEKSPVGVCTVIGFPLGAGNPAVKAAEAAAAVRAGATELDVVMNIGFLKSGFIRQVKDDLEGVLHAARHEGQGVTVKIILEACLLTDEEKVEACRLAVAVGADYVKTSTGFSNGGALVSDVRLLRKSVGSETGVKASGGIRNLAAALSMLNAGANRLGSSSGVAIINELKLQRT
ncbi:MAG: Deoxyribose-phosphate aldolase 1 [Pelotomaculum sp. PtaU1.Bin035]|nr:MAG: Deoxyribose-phosphate aldolase 1 [Pelotomaculum sp. PtaU1.Bin035]